MPIFLNPESERMNIRIDGALTVMEAAEARDQLALGVATASGPIEVNLSGITEIDTAGLQLLLALARFPGNVRLTGPGVELAERIERLGLRTALRLKEDDRAP